MLQSTYPTRQRPSRRMGRRAWAFALAVALATGIPVLAYHDVSTALTVEDRDYIGRIFEAVGDPALSTAAKPASMLEQVGLVLAVQDAALKIASDERAIDFDRGREPRDLYDLRHGYCYDRSRFIEKALQFLGFEARHVAVYSTLESGNRIFALLTPQVPSHAVTEVLTAGGWMLVDSNARWIGFTSDGRAVALKDLKRDPALRRGAWHADVPDDIDDIFVHDFTYVIGLYSRHGRFYPPYNFVPDIDWHQIHHNISGMRP